MKNIDQKAGSAERVFCRIREYEDVLRALDAGESPVLVSGIGGASGAHLAAALRRQTGSPIFAVTADDGAAETLARDLRSLLDEEVLLLPARDLNFVDAESAGHDAEQRRLAALYALASGSEVHVVCSIGALLMRTVPKDLLLSAAFTLSPGQTLPPEEAERALIRCGYVHRIQADAPGQYSRRGGILDIFSPASPMPYRMEFWGDEIDSMGVFDPDTQRRTENVELCTVLPASEALPSLAEGGIGAVADALDLLVVRSARSRSAEKSRAAAVLKADAERLRESGVLSAADLHLPLIYRECATALDYIPENALLFLDHPGKAAHLALEQEKLLAEDLAAAAGRGSGSPVGAYRLPFSALAEKAKEFPAVLAENFVQGRTEPEPRAIVSVTAKQLPGYGGSLETVCDDVKHDLSQDYAVLVLASDERRAGVLRELFDDRGIPARAVDAPDAPLRCGECAVCTGALSGGFSYPNSRFTLLTDAQIMRPGLRKGKRKKLPSNRQRLESCEDLSVGDLVVHEHHGIGRFAGIVQLKTDDAEKDYIKICYAGTDVLYVPATQLDLVSKYIGAGGEDRPVKLSKMGGADWTRAKSRAKAAAKEMAGELIQLYAERRRRPGHAFAPDSPWQTEFEDAFPYEETEDQLRCIREIKHDMEAQAPMDRLLCGDVGYGKTEVALRAVMKCILDGMQAAILVPTTVLAQQHYQTVMQRFFGFPIRVEQLSRFRTPAQVRAAKAGLADGSVDIVVGTHALLQKDIRFKKLGLLVVDEEQRFGVSHKERLKEMSRNVDVLTLSATPIPRTLNMAMSGLRDMSTLEEPPQDRQPVQTFVMEHDWGVVTDAIRRELQRGGQVYYLHNRTETIERTAAKLLSLLPDASIAIAHGKMDEETLSSAMESVVSGETQILVCTTIIETGIDIPNVNTLIIEDADRLGLAQLHQIRGRIGRSGRRATAYLTYRKDKVLTEIAEKRLSAIREFAEFNSGFRIAMRDLEIRGAGNLLGAEQSGHLIDVGYDMYLRLLEEAVLEEKGEQPKKRAECAADLAVSANIPESYVSSAEIRMDLYRRIALIRGEADADDLTDELIDRFGEPPRAVNALIHVALLRGEATEAGILDISQKGGWLRFKTSDFDFNRISALNSTQFYRNRLKVEQGQTPCISLKLTPGSRVLDTARKFVADYSAAQPAQQ